MCMDKNHKFHKFFSEINKSKMFDIYFHEQLADTKTK